MLKKIIQVAFLFIGGALGLIFLPPLYAFMNLSSNPWLNNPYFSVAIGAALLFVLSFALSDYFVKLITWLEEVLFKLPAADLLFGTLGLIVGLCVATLVGVAINQMNIPVITAVVPAILSIVLGYLGFRLGFSKRDELLQIFPGNRRKSVRVTVLSRKFRIRSSINYLIQVSLLMAVLLIFQQQGLLKGF